MYVNKATVIYVLVNTWWPYRLRNVTRVLVYNLLGFTSIMYMHLSCCLR